MDPTSSIKREAAKCVACGLCLPHCPTYDLMQDEAESPRGRLSLMLALANGNLPLSASLESHLARCLDCRACERVCPSYVGYGQALDSVRALIEDTNAPLSRPAAKSVALLHWLVERPGRISTLAKVLRMYQLTGLQWLLRVSRVLHLLGLANLEGNLPRLSPQQPFAEIYPAQKPSTARVALFTGCLTPLTDQQTLISSIRFLNRLGFEVHVPPHQGCCGALHLHNGHYKKAADLMRQNIDAFSNTKETILCTASGCSATLGEYGKYQDNNESADRFSDRVMDINQFIAQLKWPAELSFRPLAKRIAVHDPCTLTHVLRQEDKPHALLARIPEAEVIPLPGNAMCCGAAGTYHLTQPQIAHRLRALKIKHLEKLAPDILVTSNPGCATHLAAGIREAGLAIEVLHPVVLLERQLQAASSR